MMAKEDRYNLDGVDDDLGSSSGPAATSETNIEADVNANTENEAKTERSSEQQRDSSENSAQGGSDSVPHRVRYDSPKENRTAKTFYLDDEQDIGRIRELQTVAKGEFDEKVHQLDVYVAAFRSDLSEESFLTEMQNIGYGYFE